MRELAASFPRQMDDAIEWVAETSDTADASGLSSVAAAPSNALTDRCFAKLWSVACAGLGAAAVPSVSRIILGSAGSAMQVERSACVSVTKTGGKLVTRTR